MGDSDDLARDHSLLSRTLFFLTLLLAAVVSWLAASQIAGILSYTGLPAYLVSCTLIIGAVFCWKSRLRVNDTRGVSPDLSAIVCALSARLSARAPEIVSSPSVADASIKYHGRRVRLVVPLVLDILARRDVVRTGAVVAHELAHLKNGDAWRAALVRQSVRFSACMVVQVIVVQLLLRLKFWIGWTRTMGLTWISEEQGMATLKGFAPQLGMITALVLAYAAFLRMREFEADRVAAKLGYADALAGVLRQQTERGTLWTAFHPRSSERALALERPETAYLADPITSALLGCVGYLVMEEPLNLRVAEESELNQRLASLIRGVVSEAAGGTLYCTLCRNDGGTVSAARRQPARRRPSPSATDLALHSKD